MSDSQRKWTTDSTGWRRWPDADLEAYIARYQGAEWEVGTQDDDLIQLLDDMEQELADREEFREDQPDTPSLQDSGNYLGSYES